MNLEAVKNFIRVELDVDADDGILVQLISATEAHTERRINCKIEVVKKENDGEIPADLEAWMMSHIATMYANREQITYLKPSKVELWDRMLDAHIRY